MSSVLSGRGRIITGHAGVGKTTRLTDILKELLPNLTLVSGQVIPVVSAMHGARRRLAARLHDIQRDKRDDCEGVEFAVETIDSLALTIANKGRRLIGREVPLIPYSSSTKNPVVGTLRVEDICAVASGILEKPEAMQMVANSYPVVFIDEFQDCKRERLEFVKKLSGCVPVVVAADEYQDIDSESQDAPAVTWARANLTVEDLGAASKRTNNTQVLNSAQALRGMTSAGNSRVPTVAVKYAGAAASTIMTYVRGKGWKGRTAILSFTMDCEFVKDVMKSLNKERKPGDKMQLLPFSVLSSEEDEVSYGLGELRELVPEEFIDSWRSVPDAASEAVRSAWEYCRKLARRKGMLHISRTEIEERVVQVIHARRSFGAAYGSRVALTIHSAKNQEWDTIFVLWNPRQFPACFSEKYKKRILYNAITRAKCNCLVLVYDPKGNIMSKDAKGNIVSSTDPVLKCLIGG